MIQIELNKTLHGANGDMNLDVNFSVQNGEFLALSGKSGSGKTTLLRILAGLEKADGQIIVNGEVWQDTNTFLAVQERRIGFVFQDYALFANMSVEQNLLFVSKDKKLATHLLDISELTRLKHKRPATLSGGQKQRLSLCRAMMLRPQLLLMDEPLSALDPKMRHKLQEEIYTLHKEFKTTTIMVSHEPSEIYKLAERMIVLEDGKIINDGSPKELLLHTDGSAKFSFEGEVLEVIKADVIYIAVISIGQQIVKVVISESEAKSLKSGDKVSLSTKAFSPTITKRKI